MEKIIDNYFKHLSENPERIDALLIWTLCTLFCWILLLKYRERMITGLEGGNNFWEAGEQFTWLIQFITPPVVFYFLCFVPEHRIYVLYLNGIVVLYLIGNKWLAVYGLVVGGKATMEDLKQVEKEEKKEETK